MSAVRLTSVLENADSDECSSVEHLTLQGLIFNESTACRLVSVLPKLKLDCLECINCSEIEVQDLGKLLAHAQTIRFCAVDVQMRKAADVKKFAELANRLVGKTNLSLRSLERVPSKYLEYPWQCYRSMFPSGNISNN